MRLTRKKIYNEKIGKKHQPFFSTLPNTINVFNQGLNTDRTRLTPHLPVINEQAVTVKFIKTFDVR